MKIKFLDSVQKIKKTDWQKLNTSSSPLLDYEFFKELENSHSVSSTSGWQPHHLTISNGNSIEGILPLYIKQHSWGEYVFDWNWAQAYEQHELPYYPKLVATIPFTPVTSDKFFSVHLKQNEIFNILTEHCQQNFLNSWHVLYCPENNEKLNLPADVYQRNTVQFQWVNRNYQDFDEFVATFSSRKRKNTLKERASIKQQGLEIRQLKGAEISRKELDFFYLTYQLTYLKNGHRPHLSFEFFHNIFIALPDNILLIIASSEKNNVACALFFYDQSHLYGRYWGSSESFKNLHFELCYYQGIEFCIEHKLQIFNPGTQGEHKIQRGFEPILTHSYHWIKHPAFKDAIKKFCLHERQQMKIYQQQCQQGLPFKNNE